MARRKPKPALPDHLLEAVARRFRALGVPSRLRILNALMNGPLGMFELAQATGNPRLAAEMRARADGFARSVPFFETPVGPRPVLGDAGDAPLR